MSDFGGMEDLLQDFVVEAGDLLSAVDNRLVQLERSPADRELLNDIFRGFHTIKGGAGFLAVGELVTLCHLTETLLDRLRRGELSITPAVLDVILAATGAARDMLIELDHGAQPPAADSALITVLGAALASAEPADGAGVREAARTPLSARAAAPAGTGGEPDWDAMYRAVSGLAADCKGTVDEPALVSPTTEIGDGAPDIVHAVPGRRAGERQRDNAIRVDTARIDQVLTLSGEIGLTRNRLNALRGDILGGRSDNETLHALDLAVSQLDLLVADLQNAVMKTRMQPIGRLFQKYPRIARDLARSLGKDVELVISGEETEIDKTMIEDLSDPIIHLIRNAVDHGVEDAAERAAAGKPQRSVLRLEARQEGDHIVIVVADDGRGMDAARLRAKALAQGLIDDAEASTLDERQSYNLIFLPGFSMAEQVSDLSGRGVGMDVVRTNIQKLNGTIEIRSQQGRGTTLVIQLPLTLAILPVLLARLGEQPFAVPLSMVREIVPIVPETIQEVGGRAIMVVRGEVLPVLPLCELLGWPQEQVPEYGVLMQTAELSFVLGVDSFAGREDVVIKSLDDFRPRGVAGVTTQSDGRIVLILDMKELLGPVGAQRGVPRSALQRPTQGRQFLPQPA